MSQKRALAFPAAPPTAPTENLLRLTEAAERLGLAASTLKKMALRRAIPSVKYGKLRLFEPHVLREYIAKHRVG